MDGIGASQCVYCLANPRVMRSMTLASRTMDKPMMVDVPIIRVVSP